MNPADSAQSEPHRAAGYDRDLIAAMLESPFQFSPVAIKEQIRALRAADDRDAAGVHTDRSADATAIDPACGQCGYVFSTALPRCPSCTTMREGAGNG